MPVLQRHTIIDSAWHKSICALYISLLVLYWPLNSQKIVVCPLSTDPLLLNLSHDYGMDWIGHPTASSGLIVTARYIVVSVPSVVDPVVVHAEAIAPRLGAEESTGVDQVRMGSRTIVRRCNDDVSEWLHEPISANLLGRCCAVSVRLLTKTHHFTNLAQTNAIHHCG